MGAQWPDVILAILISKSGMTPGISQAGGATFRGDTRLMTYKAGGWPMGVQYLRWDTRWLPKSSPI